MELRWWVVAIAGCVALAGVVVAGLLWPGRAEDRPSRRLANTSRLTRLPEYVRAARMRMLVVVVSIVLLVACFAAAVLAGARPAGLPSALSQSDRVQPEDIMLCVGGSLGDPAVAATLQYFAERVTTFGTERIAVTSADRRVVPMTRDYQYVAGLLYEYAQPRPPRGLAAGFAPAVSYVDYEPDVDDVLALCLTGFPGFEKRTMQRRSVIYVGPASLREPADDRPEVFTADRVTDLAGTAGVQVNAIVTSPGADTVDMLARRTGGRAYLADSDVAAQLDAIRQHPPAAVTAADSGRPAESPDIPLAIALLAVTALAIGRAVLR